MFRRRSRADAEHAPPEADAEHAAAPAGQPVADPEPAGMVGLPMDDALWDPAPTPTTSPAAWSDDSFGSVGDATPATTSPAPASSPFGPVSDPFGGMATGAATATGTALLEHPAAATGTHWVEEAPPAQTHPTAPAHTSAAPTWTDTTTAPTPHETTVTDTTGAESSYETTSYETSHETASYETTAAETRWSEPQAGATPVEAPAPAPAPSGSALPVHVDRPMLRPDLLRLKVAAQDALVERMGARLYDRTLLDDQIEDLVGNELSSFLSERQVELADDDRLLFTEEVINDLLRHGPIEPYLRDDSVSEVMVNGLESIYVERNGRLTETSSKFLTEAHLRQIIERIVSKVGRRIDESSPMVDARLPDGSRVNAVIPPLAVDGPSLTIRKFAKDALGVDDLVRFGTLDRRSVEFLAACVRGRLNVLVSGGTGTGKTTLLNTLSSFIPDDERIVTIEDAVELQLHQRHIVRLESRPANVEGKGQITIRDLVRNSLRMRPDRVIIGECRGGEALDMLQAMNTGHDGSLSTLHSNGPRDALSRLETLCLMAGMELPMRAIREQIASAVHLIVHVARLRDGSRKVTHITEVVGLEGETITLSDIFTFDFDAGFDEEGHYLGTLQPTGLVPGVVRKLEEHGVHVSNDLFDTGEDW